MQVEGLVNGLRDITRRGSRSSGGGSDCPLTADISARTGWQKMPEVRSGQLNSHPGAGAGDARPTCCALLSHHLPQCNSPTPEVVACPHCSTGHTSCALLLSTPLLSVDCCSPGRTLNVCTCRLLQRAMETGRTLLQLIARKFSVPVDCVTMIKLFHTDKEIHMETPLFEAESQSREVRAACSSTCRHSSCNKKLSAVTACSFEKRPSCIRHYRLLLLL